MERRDSSVALVLRHLGLPVGQLDSFEGRKILQKIVYLLQEGKTRWHFGFAFNLYIRGPYAPALADEAYRLPRDPAALTSLIGGAELRPECQDDIRKLKALFGRDGSFDSELLELTATVQFLLRYSLAYMPNPSDRIQAARDWVSANKPHLEDRFGDALEKLRVIEALHEGEEIGAQV